MTLAEIKVLRDAAYAALVALDLGQTTHSVDGESYDHDGHRKSLVETFEKWDALYNRKATAGRTYRLNKKAV